MAHKIKELIETLKQNPNEYISKAHTIRLAEILCMEEERDVATEDKKAPDAETFLQSKDIWHHPMVMDRSHKTGYEIADLLTEHASNERTKAIQQCEDFIKDWYENERALEGKDFYTELSKLKK